MNAILSSLKMTAPLALWQGILLWALGATFGFSVSMARRQR